MVTYVKYEARYEIARRMGEGEEGERTERREEWMTYSSLKRPRRDARRPGTDEGIVVTQSTRHLIKKLACCPKDLVEVGDTAKGMRQRNGWNERSASREPTRKITLRNNSALVIDEKGMSFLCGR